MVRPERPVRTGFDRDHGLAGDREAAEHVAEAIEAVRLKDAEQRRQFVAGAMADPTQCERWTPSAATSRR